MILDFNITAANEKAITRSLKTGSPIKNPMLLSIIHNIFKNIPVNLPELALVCKTWKNIVDSKEFKKIIPLPQQAFGRQKWLKYIGVDPGEEPTPYFPRWIYKYLDTNKCTMTFIPKKVKKTQADGTVLEIALDTLKNIGELVENPIKGHRMGYSRNAWKRALEEVRDMEEAHWVVISKKAIGRNKTYIQQQEEYMDEANMSDLRGTVLSVFMEYVRFKNCLFVWDPPVNGQKTLLHLDDQTDGFVLGIGFDPSGLNIVGSCLCDDNLASQHIAYVPALKSWGL